MSSHNRSQPSQRQLRVGEQIKHIIADTMLRGHFRDKSLIDAAAVTVTEVRISPDLKNATAYVIALGGADIAKFLPALNDHASTFQKEIARQANLKFTPRIRFASDTSFDNVQRIEQILHEIKYADDNDSESN